MANKTNKPFFIDRYVIDKCGFKALKMANKDSLGGKA